MKRDASKVKPIVISQKMLEAALVVVTAYESYGPVPENQSILSRLSSVRDRRAYESALRAFDEAAVEANPELDRHKSKGQFRTFLETKSSAGPQLNALLKQVAEENGKSVPKPYMTYMGL